MNWFKQQLANVAGTEEPEYGPSAVQSVTEQMQTTPYTEVTPDDLIWKAMDTTNVETQTFYFMWGAGMVCMAQVIYSNVGGFRTTCQFNSKIFNHEGPDKHLWCSDPLENCGFDVPQTGFYADNVALTLNEEGDSYTVKSAVNDECIMSLTVTRKAPGFQVGKDGTSYFGTDPENPWGSMRHVFWPRCSVTGTIQTKLTTYTVDGRALFIHALQGMKPHHLAARWNFANFQTPTYSAVLMEFTTPKSYGKTVVSIGGIVKDNEIVCAGTCTAKHLASKQETEYDWPEPTAVLFEWSGQSPDGQDVSARIEGDLPHRTDRIDVLSHLPGFVKSFISGATGLKPHIFQYCSKDELDLKVKIGDHETSEPGQLFSEATFIS